METTLDKFGRVVIPKEIRGTLGLKPGEVFEIGGSDNKVIMKPLRNELPLKIKEGVLIFTGTVTGDIMEAVRLHRKERIKRLVVSKKR